MGIKDYLAGEAPESVAYKEIAGEKLNLLLVKPEGWRRNGHRTAVVWIHGGSWTTGTPEYFVPHCRYFAKRGAVCFSIQYRLAGTARETAGSGPETTVADCLADCGSAIRFVRKNAGRFGIDAGRIVVGGDSAGGHLAVCLGTLDRFDTEEEDLSVSAKPDVVIDCNGIIDMTLKWKYILQPASVAGADGTNEMGKWHEWMNTAYGLSPIYHIRKGQPPVLILQGMRDTVVEPEDSFRYCQAVKAAGNVAELVLLPDARHAFILFNYSSTDEELAYAVRVIDRFLTGLGLLDGQPLV